MSSARQTQRCSRCGECKPLSDFSWHRRALGKLNAYCRPCQAAYKRAHYIANRDRYIAQTARRREAVVTERTEWLFDYFQDHPCADCGESDPVILEFDHLDRKNFDIAYGIRRLRWSTVLDEIAKCDVVCPNCHRRRTVLRGGFARAIAAEAAAARGAEASRETPDG